MPQTMPFDDCLAELATMGRTEIKKFIDFMPARPETVNGWILSLSKPPVGEKYLFAELFFSLRDRQIEELAEVDPYACQLGRYWAAGIATADELKTALGYRETDNQCLIDIATGHRTPLSHGLTGLTSLMHEREDAYHRKYQQLAKIYGTSDPPAPMSPTALDRSALIGILTASLIAAAPIAALIETGNSDDEREAVRQAVGPERFFLLSTALNKMLGWRARQEIEARAKSTSAKGAS